YEYIGITDHSKSLFVANGLSEARLLQQIQEIKEIDKEYDDIDVHLLKYPFQCLHRHQCHQIQEIKEIDKEYDDIDVYAGIEMDILADGSLDYDDEILKQLDYVIAAIHSSFSQSQ